MLFRTITHVHKHNYLYQYRHALGDLHRTYWTNTCRFCSL